MIVDDPAEPGGYDAEWVVMLDDWTDGIGQDPQQIYDDLRTGQHMPSMASMHDMPGMPGMSGCGRQRHCSAGTPATSATPTTCQRTDPRSADHIHRQARAAGTDPDHQRRLRHRVPGRVGRPPDDGHPHRRISRAADRRRRAADRHGGTLRRDRHRRATASSRWSRSAEGKTRSARALLSTGAGAPPDPGFRPPELNERVGTVDMFTATPAVDLGFGAARLDAVRPRWPAA